VFSAAKKGVDNERQVVLGEIAATKNISADTDAGRHLIEHVMNRLEGSAFMGGA